MTLDFDSDRLYDDEKNDGGLDSFELLSAYLDNELNPSERKEVQHRLDNDPKTQKMYASLLRLQSQMQNSTAPPNELPVEDLSLKVFQKIDRTQRHRKIRVWGGAIAAAALAAVSGIVPGTNSPVLRLVNSSEREIFTQPIMLAVAVDKPAVKIPKAAVAAPKAE